ncbi:lysoplasmalogenase [Gordonia oryzae]|uniref:Lysoplasmalogenase n=1 Tax=Gordonia oryzae TaxID=2487349 RepID=A0A3N4GJI1_9ACTN|nr:lysoplasmalogenase family protein [Gordonia oryzae]RPA62335.1 lysoplasmalogenase [Gordonia oryzae]
MRRLPYALASGVAAITGAYGSRRAAALTKPVPLALLAVEVGRRWHTRAPVDNALLGAAVVCSAAGDRAMLTEEFTPTTPEDQRTRLPLAHPLSTKDSRLALGAALFAGAQLSYCALLWRRGARPRVREVAPRMLALAESAAVIGYHRPRLLSVLGPYGNTLATMSALAASAPTGQPTLRIGGLLFLASDLSILNRRHLMSNPVRRRAVEVWVLASYFTAQALLVGTLAE